MFRRLTMLGSASLMLVVPEQAASSDASDYCVKPIAIEKIDAKEPYSQSQGPSKLKFAFEASTPFPVDNVKDPPDAKTYYSREVFWYVKSDYRLVGPVPIASYRILGTDGRLLYFLEQKDVDALGQSRENQIWSLAPDGQMEPVDGPWSDEKWKLSLENGKTNGGELILIGWSQEPGSPNHQSYFSLKDGLVRSLGQDRPFTPTKTFPDFGVEVDNRQGLSIKHINVQTPLIMSLPHTSEHGWWESVNIDRYGWLFSEGYGNDYAIKLKIDKDVSVDRIHRFTGRGWFGRFVEWLFRIGPENKIDSTQWSSQCVDYSPALRLTMFCDPAKVLRDGVLQDFPDHPGVLDRYLGDASHAGVALIKGQNNELYAFNGTELKLLSDTLGSFVKTHDVPEASRTFVTSGTGAYELTGAFPNLALAELAYRTNVGAGSDEAKTLKQAFRSMRFFSAPGSEAVLGFNQNSVWAFGRESNTRVWQSSYSRILTSEIAPVADWRGLMFLTSDSQANVIERCTK